MNSIMRLVAFALVILPSALAIAQVDNPASGDPDTVPISGLEWLLGAGVLFGIKRIFEIRKKK